MQFRKKLLLIGCSLFIPSIFITTSGVFISNINSHIIMNYANKMQINKENRAKYKLEKVISYKGSNSSMTLMAIGNVGASGSHSEEKSNSWTYEIDINDFIGNYVIGDIQKYKYSNLVNILINDTSKNATWYSNLLDKTNYYGLFRTLNGSVEWGDRNRKKIKEEISHVSFSLNDIKDKELRYAYGNARYYDRGWFEAVDEALISMNTSVKYDTSMNKIILKLNNWIKGEDDGSPETQSYSKSEIKLVNRDSIINYDLTVPYSNNDLNTFREKFNNIIAKPIRIKNATNPIIFDYKDNNSNLVNENEQYVLDEIAKRIDLFNQDADFLNQFGTIVEYDEQQKKWINTDDVKIELDINPSIRGKVGSQVCNVIFKLNNARKFDFGNNQGPKNQYSLPINIYLELDPNIDYEIDNLVQIIPYKSATDQNNEYYVNNKNLNQTLGGNSPDPKEIGLFSINLNQPDKTGTYPLIDQQKLPIINKQGTKIIIDLVIDIENTIINKQLVFDRVFNNGELFSSITLNESDYKAAKFRFEDHELNFGLRMKNDQIILFNQKPFKLTTSYSNDELYQNEHDIVIKVANATVEIPVEQATKPSKWVQITDSQFFEDKQLKYVGEFQTFDPFVFKLKAVQIPLKDPITGDFIGYASKYKPFIRKGKFDANNIANNQDEAIFPNPQTTENDAYYEANLGSYVMKNKTQDGKIDFQIVIKEYDQNAKDDNIDERYNQDRWIIGVSMNLLSSQASFQMSGYKDNKLIEEENKQKYFNKDSVYYRGDYINEETGMYKPKLVWVNAYPPESFLYDPIDALGNNIVNPNLAGDEYLEACKKAKYHIGYIAELNATGFAANDYGAIPSFGGYETNFNTNIFVPTGLIPYSEFYTYNTNSIEPNVERTPLSQSGLQTIKSTANFRQIVLKRPNSNNYLYQFVKIANSSNEIVNHKDLIDLFGSNLKGLDNQPLFVDFWETPQGQHLMGYLINEYQLFENEEKVKELEYSEIIQYWNIYVNDPKHYQQDFIIQQEYDISKIKPYLQNFRLSSAQLETLRKLVTNEISDQLTKILAQMGWIDTNKIPQLIYNTHFKIEASNELFEMKLNQLIQNYSLDLNEAKFVDFEIIMIDSGFSNQIIKPVGKTSISVLNNKDANKIIDLSNFTGSKLSINSNHEYFQQAPNMIELIKQTILESINSDLKRIINQSDLEFVENFLPTQNKDYQLVFYTKYYDENGIQKTKQYASIEQAIKSVLLHNTDNHVFYNTLLVDVVAKFNDESHFMMNSFSKTIINNSNQTEAIIDLQPFDISNIKANDIKINTTSPDFSLEPNKTKTQKIFDLMISRIYHDINFWARKWLQINQVEILYQTDFEIKLIKSFDHNNQPIYYETNNILDIYDVIQTVLLDGIENEPEFNRDLYFSVVATKYSHLQGSFIKKINNNYLNKAIEEDDLDNIIIDNEVNDANDFDNTKVPLANDTDNTNDFDWWWVITPITVLVVVVVVLVIVYIIRKNRKIR